jgi:hypothetical protein
MGFTDLSKKKINADGSTSVAIDSPLSTFGELLTAKLTPVAQGDFVFNVNNQIFTNRQFAGGTLTVSDGMAVLDSGTDPSGSAVVQLRRGLKYKPGQGSLMRATALFDTPSAGNAQFIGLGSSECGYFIGYFGEYFGILHSEDGQREIRKLTITTGATTGNVTVTLDGDSISVPVTGGSDITQTAYQLSLQDYSNVGNGGWLADAIGDSVYFLSARSGPMGGSYSVAGSSIVGTFSQIKAGEAQTNTFIPSGSFNIDTLDGNGPSRMIFDPQMGNVFQIGFQYLGFGNAKFYIENPETGGPQQFHEIKNANSRTTPVLSNPNVNVLATCANIGGITSTQLRTVSMAAYVEGDLYKLDPKFAYSKTINALSSLSYVPLTLLKVNRIFHNKSCYGEFDLLQVAASNDANTKTLTIGFFLNAEVSGDVNYQYIDQNNSIVSYAELDPATQTITTTGLPFYEIVVGGNSSTSFDIKDLQFVFGPGSSLLIAAKVSSSPINGSVSINWYEQQ